MENQLAINTEQIIVTQGSVKFNEYENLKRQAERLAEQIKTVHVDEENIKQSKKLLAAVNKRLKQLEDKRIEVKKTMLEPYTLFEQQVKDIVGIVKDADSIVRDQVRFLEEMDRQKKQDQLQQLFNRRKKHYILGDLLKADDFLQAKHLNKTATIEATEKEMVTFFEKTSSDYKVIETLPNAKEVLAAYIEVYDLAAAMQQANAEKAKKEQLEASKAMKKAAAANKIYRIHLYDEKDFKLATMFMQQNDIKYDFLEV
jgi:hypothetical protein